MTGAADRRMALGGLLAALATPLLAPAAGAQSLARFAPPAGELLYRRRLTRELGNGEAIIATREFAIRFRMSAGAFRVTGRQISSEIEAPAALAEVARIERERIETGVFPLLLDRSGRILGHAANGAEAAPAERGAAARELEAMVQRGPLPAEPRQEAEIYLRTMAEANSLVTAQLPTELFVPPAREWREERSIALPGGQRGMLSVLFGGTADPVDGLMRSAYRKIETRLEGTVRRTREEWTLTPRN